jgi:predicted RNase H-like HicB family nuclease
LGYGEFRLDTPPLAAGSFIYPGDESGYVAECLHLAVVTQGPTIDETVQNLREAIRLHLEGEDLAEMGLVSNPPLLVTMEMEPVHA